MLGLILALGDTDGLMEGDKEADKDGEILGEID